MLADQASHFKHRHLRLAEHGQQFFVRIDHALVGAVLQAFGFDVNPQLFDNFSARQSFFAHHGGEFGAQRQRLHEGCVGGALFRSVCGGDWRGCCRCFSFCGDLFGGSFRGGCGCGRGRNGRCCYGGRCGLDSNLFGWSSFGSWHFFCRCFFCSCHDRFPSRQLTNHHQSRRSGSLCGHSGCYWRKTPFSEGKHFISNLLLQIHP